MHGELLPMDRFFRLGIELTRMQLAKVREARLYYLGRRKRPPDCLLSEIFDAERGGSLAYFRQAAYQINTCGLLDCVCPTREFRAFKGSCSELLEELRVFAIELAPFLDDPADRQKRVSRALKFAIRCFRVNSARFFKPLSWHGQIMCRLLANHHDEAMGIAAAAHFLNDIAKAFEVRERQLTGIGDQPLHTFIAHEFASIDAQLRDMRKDVTALHDKVGILPDLYNRTTDVFKRLERLFNTVLAWANTSRSGELSQEQVARDFGVSRMAVIRWEKHQTIDGPDNKSNKFGYYRSLRTNPELREAYAALVRCARLYHSERQKAIRAGHRFVTFIRFHEEWLKHQSDKMLHLK